MNAIEWVRCPVCGNKTRNRMRDDTELKNFPLYCPKCKQETLINVKNSILTVCKGTSKQQASNLVIYLDFLSKIAYNMSWNILLLSAVTERVLSMPITK